MRVIVFGGSGFLGSHIADALTEAGHEVTVFDIRESPYLRAGQKMLTGDIMDEGAVNRAVQGHEVVYNLAGIADIDECIYRPVDTARYNIVGNVILLEASKKADIKRFIFASSAYVFSDAGAFYRISKQACESFIEDYQKLYGLPYTVLRYGSLYGDRADERNSIFRLLKDALIEGKITYGGTGEEVREYIHVKDAASLSVRVLDLEFKNQHIILTGNQTMKYRDLLDMIKEMLKGKVRIDYLTKASESHYTLTPYNFSPKLGRKLVNNPHIDFGQGLLGCMAEIYRKYELGTGAEMGYVAPKDDE